jgi:uncharacterized protein (DUF1697 family)
MNTYVVFLRGVNVGGNTIIKMKEFVPVLENNKFYKVKSYINSGNVTFQCDCNSQRLNEIIKNLILKQYGFSVELIVKTKKEITDIIHNSPYKKDENDNSKRLVAMLSETIDKSKKSILLNDANIKEIYYPDNNLIYIYYQNGVGKSKFSNSYIENRLNVISTSRNWNTLLKILEIMNNGN